MPLGDFDVVYRNYHNVVKFEQERIRGQSTYEEFAWQPYRLLEAYSLAHHCIEDKSVLYTTQWDRQSGATTSAIAMLMTCKDIVMLVSDTRTAKSTSSRIFRAFQKQSGHIHSHVRPSVIHKQLWWTSGLHQCAIGNRPELVIVDSETAYRKDRDQAIDDLQSFFKCGILVLDAPRPPWLI